MVKFLVGWVRDDADTRLLCVLLACVCTMLILQFYDKQYHMCSALLDTIAWSCDDVKFTKTLYALRVFGRKFSIEITMVVGEQKVHTSRYKILQHTGAM